MEKHEIVQILEEHVCQVVFRKVTTGHWRVMYATRNPLFVPVWAQNRLDRIEPYIQYMVEISGNSKLKNWIIVWDFVHNYWRSFYSTTVVDLDVSVERTLIKQYDGMIKPKYKINEDGSAEKIGWSASDDYRAFGFPEPTGE